MLAAVAFRPVANALGGGAAGFAAAGSVFGVLLALPWFAVFAVTWERPDFQARPPSIGFREGLRLVSSHRSFRQLVSFFVCGRIAMDLAGAMMILYFTHVLARSGEFERMLGLLMGTVLLCMPLWLRLSRHSEKSRMFMFGACWWAAAQVILLLAQPDWPIWALLVFAPLTGVGYAAVDLMPWSMVGEVVDEDELRSGERQEGLYYGFFTFLRKLTGTIAVSLALGVLGAVGFTRGEQQSESTVDAIRLLAGLGPMLFLLASVWLARGYPLTRVRHAEILAELARRRAET